ncbi:MAG: hypothetical protein J5826_02290, partial [Bacteroidales bacterium]|nr:hypothetical protein [Bacteroidales bacterium]
GPGESKLEMNRRRIRDRMTELRRRLDELEKQRAIRRKNRRISHKYANQFYSTLYYCRLKRFVSFCGRTRLPEQSPYRNLRKNRRPIHTYNRRMGYACKGR